MHLRTAVGAGFAVTLFALSATASAQEFALQVGPPVAGNAPSAKRAVLVVRPIGCADPAQAQITATAEGILNGSRRSVPLTLAALPTPGVHAIQPEWPSAGVWIISLIGNCAGKSAGAIVSVAGPGPQPTFVRDVVKYYRYAPTPSEIDASLKALKAGSEK